MEGAKMTEHGRKTREDREENAEPKKERERASSRAKLPRFR